MTLARSERHVYLRQIAEGERTSLSVLAGFVEAGSKVLDLGTGSGAMGQHLRDVKGCTVDGVTINDDEAALARPYYRRVEVADLESPDWPARFQGERYDFVICADVLEHLRRPDRALAACAERLLAPGGRVLISVPNAAYGGLVADLMHGDFLYRDEGLLDRTHLRFFTRRSLVDWLGAEGWAVESVEAIERPFNESEFRFAVDRLPPAVARYVLALPDAATYQLIASARVGHEAPADERIAPPASPMPGARFSVQLYVGDEAGFAEDRKTTRMGVMGHERQTLVFPLAPDGRGSVDRLRLDPADRAGFLHLHRLTLKAAGERLWQWRCDTDGLGLLESAPHHDLTLRAPWASGRATLLLHGADPRLELPIPPDVVRTAIGAGDSQLEVELGWPMSADYLALVETVEPLHREMGRLRQAADADVARARETTEDAHRLTDRTVREKDAYAARQTELETRLEALSNEALALDDRLDMAVAEKNAGTRQYTELRADHRNLVRDYEGLARHVKEIEESNVYRMTRPLVRAKIRIDTLLGRRRAVPTLSQLTDASPTPSPDIAEPRVVDVVVPVYRGLADTRQCVESVLKATGRTPWRIVVINDASPEPEVTAWLRQAAAADTRITLLENAENLGFVGTANRGMKHGADHDVVLLNSDTEVPDGWLDRLQRAAYSAPRVASVTPFSNNATICSYPRFCEPNELPFGETVASLDRAFAEMNDGLVVDVPTGVGFCMYVRRDCLREIGFFDEEKFGKGYGEENDFCQRAIEAGWRNLHALDLFVLHTGGVSFGDSKTQREIDAVTKLRAIHPSYDAQVARFVREDPAWAARAAVDLARIRARGLPVVLAVVHNRGGGTFRHVIELAREMRHEATFLTLAPAVNGDFVWLECLEPEGSMKLAFDSRTQWDELIEFLRSIGVAHIHYHHTVGHTDAVRALGESLGTLWDVTVHDYYAACPHITLTNDEGRFCGETGEGGCTGPCSRNQGFPSGCTKDQWRGTQGALFGRARAVLAPSVDTASRVVRFFPSAHVRAASHLDLPAEMQLPTPRPIALEVTRPLRVVVLGALSEIKGANLLEEVAVLAAARKAPVEFHLLGYAFRNLKTQPRAALTVHGRYDDHDLPSLLEWLKADIAWFPAQWPETYSYTLSECLKAGLPVVAPDLGAFPERLIGRSWTWLQPWDAPAAEQLALFLRIRAGEVPAPPRLPDGMSKPTHTTEAGVWIKPWSYHTDYRDGLTVRPFTLDPRKAAHGGALKAWRRMQATGLAGAEQQARHGTLSVLSDLQRRRGFRALARTVPPRWKAGLKRWLGA